MSQSITTLLSIAGSDPVGGAGIQADIKVGAAIGVHVVTAITAVTVQNSKAFYSLNPVNPILLQRQLKAISEDVVPDAIKIGMVVSIDNLKIISEYLETLPTSVKIVVDPVISPTVVNIEQGNQNPSSSDLLFHTYRERLFPYAFVATPNLRETERLCQRRFDHIEDLFEAPSLLNLKNIIVTGFTAGNEISDVMISGNNIFENSHEVIDCSNLHGSGCVFSSLLAAFLGKGLALKQAFFETSNRLHSIIDNSCNYVFGNSSYGPLNVNNNLL